MSRVNPDSLQGLAALLLVGVGVGFAFGWAFGVCAFGLLAYADLFRGRAA